MVNPYKAPVATDLPRAGRFSRWTKVAIVFYVLIAAGGYWYSADMAEWMVVLVDWLPRDVADHLCSFLKILTG